MLNSRQMQEITRLVRRGFAITEIVLRTGFEAGDVRTAFDAIVADDLREAALEVLADIPPEYKNRVDEWRLIVEANFGRGSV